jgi:glucose-1-phosphate adenylyltransferase
MSTEQQRIGAPRRYLSRLTRGTLAVIMSGGRGERLKQLTEDRCKPAAPFGGKFRIIDFVLSNCLNSGIRQISVLTQYKAHSLIQHIGRGWGFLRGEFGEFIEIIPAQQRRGPEWYQGTADALWQNMELIRAHRPLHVLVLAGDHHLQDGLRPDDRLPRRKGSGHHRRRGRSADRPCA